jgi:hypothetical protein
MAVVIVGARERGEQPVDVTREEMPALQAHAEAMA